MINKHSRIGKLISKLSSNGVDFKKLGEVCEIYDGTHQTPKYTDNGIRFVSVENIKALSKSKKFISRADYDRYYKVKPRLNDVFMTRIGSIGVCTVIESEEELAYYVTLTLIRPNLTKIYSKYIKYIIESSLGQKELRKRTLVNATPIKINLGEIGKIVIPIPPLEIQEEIVKILDSFTELEAELEAGLEAELEARKQQYKYYYKKLLKANDKYNKITLGEVGKVSMCKRIFKKETSTVGDIPFYKIGTFGKEPNAFISQEIYEEYRKRFSFPKKGDVLLSASGTIGRRVIYNGQPAYFQDSNIIWIDNDESKVLNKFLYYFYATVEWKTEGGAIQRIYNNNIKKIKIPVPPLEEQRRIVLILDKFSVLVNNISISLPAELNAHRQQYEYYRNKLLTFKEYVG